MDVASRIPTPYFNGMAMHIKTTNVVASANAAIRKSEMFFKALIPRMSFN